MSKCHYKITRIFQVGYDGFNVESCLIKDFQNFRLLSSTIISLNIIKE